MESDEGIYLIHTREFRSLNENIYKIGRSYDLDVRIRQYPKKSKIIFAINCENSLLCERELMKIFKSKFIQKLDYGTEYFEGDKKEMIKEIYNYIDKMNIEKEKKEKDEKDDKEKKEKEFKEKKEKHEKEVKENKDIIEKEVKLNRTCHTCNYIFNFPSRLKLHFQNVIHCKKTENEIQDFFSNIEKPKNFKCNKCNYTFIQNSS